MARVVIASDGCVLDGPVHPLDLTIGPRVPGLGQAMVHIVLGAGVFEGMRAQTVSPRAIASLMSGGAEAVLPGVVKWVPLSVSTVCTRSGTAAIRWRRKSPAMRRVAFWCRSAKANLLVRSMATNR